MPRRSHGPGYIYIPNWDDFQHYQSGPRSERAPTWIKLHLSIMGSDAWLGLNPSDRCLLLGVWMTVARFGNGRARADEGWLRAQAKTPKGSLKRLNDAGFIRIRASKALALRASTEVEEEDSLSENPKSAGAAPRRKRRRAPAPEPPKQAPNGQTHRDVDEDAEWVYPPEWQEHLAKKAGRKDPEP